MSTRLLGIDYGSKRIGIALTNESGDFAAPYSIVAMSSSSSASREKAVEEIAAICQEKDVEKIVIGESKDFSGEDNRIMKDIRVFAEALTTKSGLPVLFHPEFLTSAQAERIQGKTDMLDASAAAIILQSYVDTDNNNNKNTNA